MIKALRRRLGLRVGAYCGKKKGKNITTGKVRFFSTLPAPSSLRFSGVL
jgi:hypothetical protein